MYHVKRSNNFRRKSNLFHSIVSFFNYIYQKEFIRKYMLLVIDDINFGTCLTILTRHPNIFIGILRPGWFKRSGCGCGSLRIRVVTVSSGF